MGHMLLAVLLLLSSGKVWAPTGSSDAVIKGTISYRLRIALPPNATVTVRLEDASLQDAPAQVIAERSIATEGRQVPIPFELPYDAGKIIPSHRYNVRATIEAGNQVLFRSVVTYWAITQGAPGEVNIMVEQAASPGAGSSSGTAAPRPAAQGSATSAVALEGTYWKLIRLQGKPVTADVTAREPHLILHADENKIAGSTGCNRLIGSYELKGQELHFAPAGMTMMACPEPLMTQEQAFMKMLKAVTAFRIEGQTLEFLDGDKVVARLHARYLK